MKRTTRKGILVTVLMLIALAVLSLPGNAARPTTPEVVADFCEDCALQCWYDAAYRGDEGLYWTCRNEGHTQTYCDNKVIQYYNSCISVLCNSIGCSIPPKSYRLCKTGECY